MNAARIAMVAGEPSGDLLASLLLRGLQSRQPDLTSYGIGGAHMQALGFRSLWPMEQLAVHGYWDALKHYRAIKRTQDQLAKTLVASPPTLFIGTDAPDFNLGLERQLRQTGIHTVHFVSPSIWAWRGARIDLIREAAELVLCLFPFETQIYERAGIRAAYVGHPLADVIPLQPDPIAARMRLGLDTARPVIAVLPGSRRGEIERIAPIFVQTVRLVSARLPNARFIVPMATPAMRSVFERVLAAGDPGRTLPLQVLDGRSHTAIEASDAVLVASGTATLECALYKKPMVIAYRVAWLSYQIMRRMAYLPHIGLPNILLGESVVPELVQDHATPYALADALMRQLRDDKARVRLEQRFMGMHEALRRDTGQQAASAILPFLAGASL